MLYTRGEGREWMENQPEEGKAVSSARSFLSRRNGNVQSQQKLSLFSEHPSQGLSRLPSATRQFQFMGRGDEGSGSLPCARVSCLPTLHVRLLVIVIDDVVTMICALIEK